MIRILSEEKRQEINEHNTNPQMQERVASSSGKEDEKQGKNVSEFLINI